MSPFKQEACTVTSITHILSKPTVLAYGIITLQQFLPYCS